MRARFPPLLVALSIVGACLATGDPAVEGELVISEVMANPAGIDDADGEYFEIHNAGMRAIDLRGYSIADSAASGPRPPLRIRQRLVVPPGGYLVLAASADRSRNGGIEVDFAFGDALQLANGGDAIQLLSPAGVMVDRVRYASAHSGVARELTDPTQDNADAGSGAWADAHRVYHPRNRGSPGMPWRARGEPAAAPLAIDAADYRDPLEFGAPRDADPTDDLVLEKAEFTLAYDPTRGGPAWVAWNLNASHFGDAGRCDCFRADSTLPAGVRRVLSSHYSGSGYTRGHLVRSEERTNSDPANARTFLMTNILPQHADLNAGPWLGLERHLQRLAQEEGRELYVVAGGVYPPDAPTLKGEGRVAIPSHTWKVVVALPRGHGLADVSSAASVEVIAVMMPNRAGVADEPWRSFATTTDAVEAATGLDLLHRLPDAVEAEVEAHG